MQGFTAHFFAAMMTLTVLTFPTPADMISAIRGAPSEEAQEIKRFPSLEAENPPLDAMVPMEEYLPVVSACFAPGGTASVATDECIRAINAVSGMDVDTAVDRITTDDTTLKIAHTFYCRSLWAASLRNRTAFDPYDCLDSA